MFKNYLKIAYRSLKRHLGYSAINVLGLAIGIAFSCMLYVFVESELSYDTFHEKSDRIFRLITIDQRVPDKVRYYGQGSPPMAVALKEDFPEVIDAVRIFQPFGHVEFKLNGQNYSERNWYTTEDDFFKLFDFKFIYGDREKALQNPFSLVMSSSAAQRYYGNENPVGKILEIAGVGSVSITGVVEDAPDNSHLSFDMLFSSISPDEDWKAYLSNWQAFGAHTYLELDNPESGSKLISKMPEFRKKYFGPLAQAFDLTFQNIHDIYFDSRNIEAGVEETHGELSYVIIFSTMGIFILIIACINYINLATSKAVFRAKEIGIRKVVGAFKKQLVFQFFTESLLVTLIALFIAIGVLDLVIPYFNLITGKSFDFNLSTLVDYAWPLLGISVIIALLAGSYPAFYLSRLKPVSTLKGESISGHRSAQLRKVLVVFQFMLTIIMIASTLIVGRQLDFVQSKDVGFDKENLMVIDINNRNVRAQFQAMKSEFAAIPGVKSVGVSSRVPGEWKNIAERYVKSPDSPGGTADSIRTYYMGFDEDMLETYGFELLLGEYFAPNGRNDSTKILLNEAAVKTLGLENPLGSTVAIPFEEGYIRTTVIGVLKDFNFQSLHKKIEPIIIGAWNNPVQIIDYFTLKTTGNVAEIIPRATEVHEKFDHFTPIEYHFLDKQMNTFYDTEVRVSRIFKMGAGLSIIVACLGLFGLAAFTIEKKKKELGVRKILGASESNLFLLLSSSFAKQILIAFLVASPVAYFAMDSWLEAFEYRVPLTFGIFLASGLIALAIAFLTIGYRSLKAVNTNPVDSLRYE